MRPGVLYACAVAGVAILAAWGMRTPPDIVLADVAFHDGREVRVVGEAGASEAWRGASRFALRQEGWSVPAVAATAPPIGATVQVDAVVARDSSGWRLAVSQWRVLEAPAVPVADWAAIMQDPQSWTDRPLRVEGVVAGGVWIADGVRAPAHGHWPPHGAVAGTARLQFQPACLCYVLHALEVAARTP